LRQMREEIMHHPHNQERVNPKLFFRLDLGHLTR
jgi:hypothetical protein